MRIMLKEDPPSVKMCGSKGAKTVNYFDREPVRRPKAEEKMKKLKNVMESGKGDATG